MTEALLERTDTMSRQPGSTIEFRDLRRTFGATTALAGLDLEARPGELLALLGPSGCGKTTALRTVAGFERADSGAVIVDGKDISGVPPHRRDVGMVFQAYSLFPHLTALDNVAFGLRMTGVARAARRARAAELIDLVGLPQHGDRFPRQLSGGQQQRVALARALALEPRVLLLDEPLSALDAKVRQSLRDEIRSLQQQLGITTLFVTHDQEEALSMADRVAVMHAGRLEQCASPAMLYQRPATAFVAEFVGVMSRIEGQLSGDGQVVRVGDRIFPIHGSLPGSDDDAAPAGGAVVDVLVRPETVQVRLDPAGTTRIVGASFLGATTRLTLRPARGPVITADVPTAEAASLSVAAAVTFALPDEPVLVDRPRRP